MADPSQRQCEGIGPTTRDGMPLVLRSVSLMKKFEFEIKKISLD